MKTKYTDLIDEFLSNRLTGKQFCERYSRLFQAESVRLPEKTFLILDELFADCDAFEPDPKLYRELMEEHPGSYLDEAGLRTAVQRAISSLRL